MTAKSPSLGSSLALIGAAIATLSVVKCASESSSLRNLANDEKSSQTSLVIKHPELSVGVEVIVQGSIQEQGRSSDFHWSRWGSEDCVGKWAWGKGAGTIYTTSYTLQDTNSEGSIKVIEKQLGVLVAPTIYSGRVECIGTLQSGPNGYYILVDRVPIKALD